MYSFLLYFLKKLVNWCIEDLRERKSDSDIGKNNTDFVAFMKQQWNDFNYTFSDGECLAEVQERNIAALNDILARYKNKTIAVGTHGTALSTIINYYDSTYGFKDFMAMVDILPWVVKMDFNDDGCIGMAEVTIWKKYACSIHRRII